VWAEAVVDAARRAVAELEDADVFAVAIRPRWSFDERPAVAWGGGEVRRRAPDPETATVRLPHSAGLLEHLDVQGLRAFRMLRQLGVDEDQPPTAEQIQRHAAEVEWPGGALPLVTGLHADPVGLARRILGQERVDAAFAGVGGRPSPPPVDRPPASREEVEALLVAAELPVAIAAQAAWGLALVGGGEGESRLGGRPDLPEGTPWPVFEGLPLTHLATIALGELPDVEGRDLLPESGHLVLMAGLQEDAELHDSDVLGGDPRVALLHVPAGTPLHRPEPPRHDPEGYDPPVVLAERRVRFEPVLTLPQIADGLPDAAASDYGELYFKLAGRTPGLDGHLLLGHPAVVHRDPRGPGDISLLHIGWDPAIGFEYLDGADITIFGAPGDVRAGRWDRLRISVQSG
jgi:hypothetical protein